MVEYDASHGRNYARYRHCGRFGRDLQVDAEVGQAGGLLAVMADPPVHVAHHAAHQGKTKALPALLGGNKGFKQVIGHRRIDPWTIVADP